MKVFALLRNKSFAALSSKITSAGLSFVFLWAIARLLPASDAGVFLYTYSLMMILVQLSRAGTEHSLIKLLNANTDRDSTVRITWRISLYVLAICLFFVSVLFVSNHLHPLDIYRSPENLDVLFLFFIVSVIFSLCQVFGSYFQARSEIYSQYWAMNVGVVLLGSVYALLLMLQEQQIDAAQMSRSFLLCSLTILLTCFVLLLKSISVMPDPGSGKHGQNIDLRTLVRQTFPYTTVTFLSISILWGAQILAGFWLNEVELAVLSVCMRLAVLVNFVHMTFEALLAPRIAHLHATSKMGELERITRLHAGISKAYALGIFLILVLFGEKLLGTFGDIYVKGYRSLLVISFSWLLISCMGPVNTILLMTDHARKFRIFLCISGATSLISSIILIPKLSVMGAVLSTSIGAILLATLSFHEARKHFKVNYLGIQSTLGQILAIRNSIAKLLQPIQQT